MDSRETVKQFQFTGQAGEAGPEGGKQWSD